MAKTILLADDSVTIQKVVELTFMDQDYEVVAVSDGNAALTKLAELQPDVLIADVHMPGSNGYMVTRQGKQQYPGLPVLLLVGTFEPFDEQEAVACGADGHLKKPFDSQDLLREVERLTVRADAASTADQPPFDEETQPLEPLGENDLAELEAEQDDLAELSLEPEPQSEGSSPIELEATDAGMSQDEDLFVESFDEPPLEYVDEASELSPPAAEPPATIREVAKEPVAAVAATSEPVAAEPAAPSPAPPEASSSNGEHALNDADIERIARRVAEILGESSVKEVAWEIVPDLAEVIIKERIRELESQVE